MTLNPIKMKKRAFFRSIPVQLFTLIFTLSVVPFVTAAANEGPLQLVYSPELEDMAGTILQRYNVTHPGNELICNQAQDQQVTYLLKEEGAVGMVNKKGLSGIQKDQLLVLTVGREVWVPVMNADHPDREEILQKGMSPEAFSRLYCPSGEQATGSNSTVINNRAGMVAYLSNNPSFRGYLADFLNCGADRIEGRVAGGTEGMVDLIRNDRKGIGFCNLSELIRLSEGDAVPGLSLVPIDGNGNGAIDYFEDIYGGIQELTHGIWLGKYPGALYSRIYMVADERSLDSEQRAFMEWMLEEGQPLLASGGFAALSQSEKYSKKEKLARAATAVVQVPARASGAKVILTVLGTILLLTLLAMLTTMLLGRVPAERKRPGEKSRLPLGEKIRSFPAGLFFDKSHTWVIMEKEGKVRIGIDDFLQYVTGPITRVMLKKPGELVKRGEPFLSLVQEGKKLEIHAPLSGTVVEQNSDLVFDSSRINDEPFAGGWVYVMEPLNWLSELRSYLMGDQYRSWLQKECSRLKDFFSCGLAPLKGIEAMPIMQEGGEITGGVLERFGPEVWEEFQTGFINNSEKS
jgi:glycine cleavage system H lipoate-binding protein